MKSNRELKFPTRDEDIRKVCGLMLGLCKKCSKSLTVQEMQMLCKKRGYLKPITKEERRYFDYVMKKKRHSKNKLKRYSKK